MTPVDDDFDTICQRLAFEGEPFASLRAAGGSGGLMVRRAIDGHQCAAIQGTKPVANYIDATTILAGLGPGTEAEREVGRAFRRSMILAAERLVRRLGLTEVNKRAASAARGQFDMRDPARGLPTDLTGFLVAMGIDGGIMPEQVFFSWQSDSPGRRTGTSLRTLSNERSRL